MLWLKNTRLLLHSMLPDSPGRWNPILSLFALSISLSLVGYFKRQGKYKTPWSEVVTCSWDFLVWVALFFFWNKLTVFDLWLRRTLWFSITEEIDFINDSAIRDMMSRRSCYVMKHKEMQDILKAWLGKSACVSGNAKNIRAEAVPSMWHSDCKLGM